MNFAKTRDISADIFRMIKQMYENQKVSAIEKDLLKDKLRQLYDEVDLIEVDHQNSISPKDHTYLSGDPKVQSDQKDKHNPNILTQVPVEEAPIDLTNTSKTDTEGIATLFDAAPLTEEDIQPELAERSKAFSDEKPLAEVHVEVNPVIKVNSKTESKPSAVNTPADEVNDLFLFNEAKELLDKLRTTPIADITKAFNLNERLMYSKELFSNNQAEMNLILQKINQLSSFDEAKKLLIDEVIYKYGWTENNKKKLAKEVIQVIKRRYIAG